METRAFEKRGSQEGSRGRKDATLLRGKFSGGCRGSAGSTPRPRRKTLWNRHRRPLRPAIPTLRAAVAARAARGRPGPWVASVPRLPPGFRGLPHPEAELKTQRMRANPFPGADARPTEKSGPVSGAGVAFEPPYPSPEESLAPPPGVGPLRGRNAPRGWTVVPSGPGPPTSEERPPPRGRAPTRAPLQPAATGPRRPMPPSPGPRQRPPPAAAGSGAKRGLQPLGAPAPPAGSRAPRRALAAHPPCDRPRLAAGARCPLEENGAGCPPGHPRPPISGGDPSREGAASAGPPLNQGGPRPPVRAPRLAPPGGRGGRPRPRPAVTHSPRPVLAEPTFGATRRFSPPQSATDRGGSAKGPPAPRRPSVPAGVADSAPRVRVASSRPPHPPCPSAAPPRDPPPRREKPRLRSAPGARLGPIFKSNQNPQEKK